MKAKDFLRKARKLDCMIANKMAEMEQWRTLATSTTAASAPETGVRVQSSGSQQRMADAIDRYIELEEEINRCIDKLIDAKKEIICVIEQLSTTEYDVLHKMYVGVVVSSQIVYLSFDEVAEKYDKSRSWATTVHGRAMKSVQKILDAQREAD